MVFDFIKVLSVLSPMATIASLCLVSMLFCDEKYYRKTSKLFFMAYMSFLIALISAGWYYITSEKFPFHEESAIVSSVAFIFGIGFLTSTAIQLVKEKPIVDKTYHQID